MARTYLLLLGLWWAAEVAMAVFRRARRGESSGRDRGSMPALFLTNGLAVTTGVLLGARHLWPLGLEPRLRLGIALAMLIAGLALRVWSVLVLGRLFTMNVAIRQGHRLVVAGPYRWLRHPSYTGMLLAFASVGVAFDSAAGLLAIVLPILVATSYRVRVEEAALLQAFGDEYRRYAARTSRLLPFIY